MAIIFLVAGKLGCKNFKKILDGVKKRDNLEKQKKVHCSWKSKKIDAKR